MGLTDAFPVVAVDHKDDSLGVLVVVAPEWADLRTKGPERRRSEDANVDTMSTTQIVRRACVTLSWPPTSHTVKEMFL